MRLIFSKYFLLLFFLPLVSCTNHGEKLSFNNGDLYFTNLVTFEEADRLGSFLVENRFFDGNQKSAQLTKENNRYQFRMVVKEKFINDLSAELNAIDFANILSAEVFEGAFVEIHFCDESFNTLKIILPE
ncbi:MAG: hypothetical protein C0425_01035 [Chlorobiaceae bacterium]|nr:hypothetical protein [Chlorobiaceae bacterium]MBA4308905.1 hypothetical protein [Chlorobiaceae bacterium]